MKWEQHVEHAPWKPRQYHGVVVYDDRLWVMAGYTGENINDVWYSEDGVQWNEVSHSPWNPRHAASLFAYDGSLWLVAGNTVASDVWRIDSDVRRLERS